MRMIGFHHVSLSVRDLHRSAPWYEALLDLELLLDENGDERRAKVYRIVSTGAVLALVEHAGNDRSAFDPTRTGLDHVAFAVPDRGAVDAWARRLDELGVEHSAPADIPLGAILNLRDPDGIQLAFFWSNASGQ